MTAGGEQCWRVVDGGGISPLIHNQFHTYNEMMSELRVSVLGEQLVGFVMITWSGSVI